MNFSSTGETQAMSSGEDFHEVILALAAQIGPCDVVVCTGAAHVDSVRAVLSSPFVSSFRLISCYAIRLMNQAQANKVAEAMGRGMRSARTHAKFALLSGPGGTVSVLTSANLNRNIRSESYMITQDPGCADMLRSHVSALEAAGAELGKAAGYYWSTLQQVLGFQQTENLSLAETIKRFI